MTLENGMEVCSCPKKDCERHGKCVECLEHHLNHKRHPPYCKRVRAKRSKKKQEA